MVEERKRSGHRSKSPHRKKSSGNDPSNSPSTSSAVMSPSSAILKGPGSSRSSSARMRKGSKANLGKEYRRGYFGGRNLRGQAGFNPFIFCSGCCDGTCNIQHGCVILGIIQMVLGFYISVYCILKILRPEAQLILTENRCVNLLAREAATVYTEEKKYQNLAALFGNLIFGYFSGILFLYAAMKLHKYYTQVYCFLMAVGVFFYFVTGTFFLNRNVHLVIQAVDCDWRTDNQTRIIIKYFPEMFVHIYCFLCGIVLFRQIRSGVYGQIVGNEDSDDDLNLEDGRANYQYSFRTPTPAWPQQESRSSMDEYLATGEVKQDVM